MNKKFFNFAKILLTIVAITVIILPVCSLFQINAGASQTKEILSANTNDYVFFVIENSKNPLAATPTNAVSVNMNVYVLVSMTFVMVILFGYSMWYLSMKHNTYVLANNLYGSSKEELINSNSFLHPIRSYQKYKNAQYDISKYYL